MTANVTRRALLVGVAAGIASVTLASCWPQPSGRTPSAPDPSAPPNSFPQPRLVTSAEGEVNVPLLARQAWVDVGAPQPVLTYAYNGALPGVTWEARPGDTVRIEVANDLPRIFGDESSATPTPSHHGTAGDPPVDAEHLLPHAWTTTNLHVHGLHVPPGPPGDDVLLVIQPGSTEKLVMQIPDDHPGGLFWYHPHHHGGVAQQVRAGMAGAIIIRGAIDDVPEVAAAAEYVMVLQALELSDDYRLLPPVPSATGSDPIWPVEQTLWTINGGRLPTMTMYEGEITRWRIVNAAPQQFVSLDAEGLELSAIAYDGLTLHSPESAAGAVLGGGNRVEMLVHAPRSGTFQVFLTSLVDGQADTAARETIFTVEVGGRGPAMRMPSALPAWDPPILPIARRRTVHYTFHGAHDGEPSFLGIDGIPFSPEQEPYTMRLNTAEEWTVVNDTPLPHVFHIHINPVKITHVDGEPLPAPLWRDTFVLAGKVGASFTFVTNLVDFTGLYVHHCHVLQHEDRGMMELIRVVDET